MHPRFLAQAKNVVGIKRQQILDHLADAASGLDRICRAAQELSVYADWLRSLRAQFEFVDIGSKEAAALAESVRLSMSEIKARLDALSNATNARPADESDNRAGSA
jgi:hypothetical protein